MGQPRPLRHITKEDLEPIWNRKDITTESIATALGVSRQAISYCAKKHGLTSRKGNHTSEKKCSDDLFIRMWNAGVNAREMAEHFGYWHSSGVTTRRRNLGLPPRSRSRDGNGSGGWRETISIKMFFEMDLAEKMRKDPCPPVKK